MLNDIIQPSRPTLSEVVKKHSRRELFVDNSFQRRLVWTEKQKIRLIETILIGYPMPEVYFWQQAADPETGEQKQSIVDGQQRITSMSQFTSNEWSLSAKYLDHKESPYSDKYWKDLPDKLKQNFWDYVINVRTIPSSVDEKSIRSIFTRLNETDKSLNPQELRNAEFNGLFIKTAEDISKLEEFRALKLFSDTYIRRMQDIEFISSLLMFLRRVEMEENTRTVNETYDAYNDTYSESSEDKKVIKDFLRRCASDYFAEPIVKEMFSKPIHLYSLFTLEQTLLDRGISTSGIPQKLHAFVKEYNDRENDNAIIHKYRQGASSRTRSKSSRALRLSSLTSWVTQK